MIRTVEIKTIQDATQLILDLEYDPEIDRMRSDYLFRGVPDTAFKLVTSLARNCGEKQTVLEASILKYFTKYAIIDYPTMDSSVWKQMIIGQHYGLPTRLLDWTHSALIAMHFATSEANAENMDKRDGVVWRIDARELSALLPENYRTMLKKERTEFFSVDSLSRVVDSTQQYDLDMGDRAMAIIEPPSTDQRIINQYSYFSITPLGIKDIETFLMENTENTIKYVIDKAVRWDIRDLLDQFNISERVIYPGLDGLCKWISRHYYVKRERDGT